MSEQEKDDLLAAIARSIMGRGGNPSTASSLTGVAICNTGVSADGVGRGYFLPMDGLRPTTALVCSSASEFLSVA
ncbi:MAG: hypothetical protein Q8R02_23375 [Hyphomonadaceae bacterium]|nr:hypothetical protein [Hyphomonadaceae bacterium]